jgi:hypothetical protein
MNGVAVLAGSISTAVFVVSALPMLYEAARTRDLGSYSLGYLALTNVGNGFHAVYVFSMPVGPIWALHSFYMLSSALMLFWYLRYEVSKRRCGSAGAKEPAVRDLDRRYSLLIKQANTGTHPGPADAQSTRLAELDQYAAR